MLPPFFRLLPNRVWRTYLGGRTLDELSGKVPAEDSHFPEDWLLSTTPARNAGREEFTTEGISRVETQEGEKLLSDLIAEFPDEFLGKEHRAKFGNSAGFLLKYLDSSIRLHIQCHPSIPFAEKFLNSRAGKAEGYYILGVRPECEGYVYLGFQRAPEKAAFREAILQQDSPQILAGFDKIPVKAGDCFYVPGGVPHAIGEGVFMVEIMEPTDFAVRIEFERGGYVLPESARFLGRDVDFALSMFDFTSRNQQETRQAFFIEPQKLDIQGEGERSSLFDRRKTNCFRAERIRVHCTCQLENDSLTALVVLHGKGELSATGKTIALAPFDRLLLPFATTRYALRGELELLAVKPPLPRP